MGKIIMKNLAFYSYHGAMKEENVLGQKFFIDLELVADIDKSAYTDSVEDTVHYGEVYQTIKDIMENSKYNLIEAVAQKIIDEIFKKFDKVEEIDIVVKKPEAPVPGIYDYFAVNFNEKRKKFKNIAYLGIGGNIGDRKKNIELSLKYLEESESIKIKKVSSLYETEPWGYTDQDWFMNIVVEIETALSPYELLDYCQYVENELKRERVIRWGPRTVDLDILLYNDYKSDDEKLTIPHPRMTERAFVMVPLYEINDSLVINGQDIKEYMKDFNAEEIRKIEE
ncbi:MAG: 2-amino-4-hydroxy-6-hydroxymethyldihydropteridine diphosphokinase [Andreesenia angusta]|nr:2-amino-4-hydroxy-6-hydroxymethyldihydropteridine diphosphokinase [Andreesenia angusta]